MYPNRSPMSKLAELKLEHQRPTGSRGISNRLALCISSRLLRFCATVSFLFATCYYLSSFPFFSERFHNGLYDELHPPQLMPIPRKIWQIQLASAQLTLPTIELVRERVVEVVKEVVQPNGVKKDDPRKDAHKKDNPKKDAAKKGKEKVEDEDTTSVGASSPNPKKPSTKPLKKAHTKRNPKLPSPSDFDTDPGVIASRSVFSWASLNTDHEYTLLSRFGADAFARFYYPRRPEFLEAFLDIRSPPLKAEILKYLVLGATGGIWADLDTVALQPAEKLIPEAWRPHVKAVVGIEYDQRDEGTIYRGMVRRVQFARWTFATAPRHPLMTKMAERTLGGLVKLAEERNSTVLEYAPTEEELEELLGAGKWSDTVLEVLSEEVGEKVEWKSLSKLPSARLWGSVLVLPQDMLGGWQAWGEGKGNTQRGVVRRYNHGVKF